MGGIYLHSLSIPPFESDSSALFYTSASLLPSPLRYSELLLVSTSAVRQVRNMQKACKTPGRRPRDFAQNFLSDGHNCVPYGNEPLIPVNIVSHTATKRVYWTEKDHNAQHCHARCTLDAADENTTL